MTEILHPYLREASRKAGLIGAKPDPRDPDPSREGMWRDHNCSYCDDGRKPCKQGGAHRCSNPHARND